MKKKNNSFLKRIKDCVISNAVDIFLLNLWSNDIDFFVINCKYLATKYT